MKESLKALPNLDDMHNFLEEVKKRLFENRNIFNNTFP